MPTNRKRRSRNHVNTEIPDWKISFLQNGTMPAGGNALERWKIEHNETNQQTVWEETRKKILADWSRKHPGTRPWAWWRFDAPRDLELMKDTAWAGKFPVAREQISGFGLTTRERYPAILPRFIFGVPLDWHEINEKKPPMFEGQAVYLKRHGLLTKSEGKKLKQADFESVSIVEILNNRPKDDT